MMNPSWMFVAECTRTLQNDDALLSRVMAVARDAADPVPLYRLANLCRRRGQLDLWHRGVELAMELPHSTHEQIVRRAAAKLTRGEWVGWIDYEHRKLNPRFQVAPFEQHLHWTCPQWDGHGDSCYHTLLVIPEQGFGDVIQMLRFIPAVSGRASRVLFSVPDPLVSLVQHNYGQLVTVIPEGAPHGEPYDCYVSLMSLLVRHMLPPTCGPQVHTSPNPY